MTRGARGKLMAKYSDLKKCAAIRRGATKEPAWRIKS